MRGNWLGKNLKIFGLLTTNEKLLRIDSVRKLLIFLLGFSLLSLIAVFASTSVSAYHRQDVLGVAVQETLSIPPTSDGPGLILPDSPLFFLDKLKQEFRLLLAFTPEQKAKIHNAIAGERLAELQIMLVKNNVAGVRVGLQGVSDNLKSASKDLDDAKLTGRNISLLAKEINDSIKEKDNKFSVLENKATGEIKAHVAAAKKSLRSSKVEVEDNLPEDLLENEMEDDLDREIEDHINNATDSAKGINRAIDVLTRLADEAERKNQEHRREALLKAIEVKNEVFGKQQEKLTEAENKAQEKITEARKKALEKAKEAAGKIDEAVKKFDEARNKANEVKSSENNSGSGKSSEPSSSGKSGKD